MAITVQIMCRQILPVANSHFYGKKLKVSTQGRHGTRSENRLSSVRQYFALLLLEFCQEQEYFVTAVIDYVSTSVILSCTT